MMARSSQVLQDKYIIEIKKKCHISNKNIDNSLYNFNCSNWTVYLALLIGPLQEILFDSNYY